MGLFGLYECFVQKQQTLEQTQKKRKEKKNKLLFSKTKAKKQKISERENDNERYVEHAFLSVRGKGRGIILGFLLSSLGNGVKQQQRHLLVCIILKSIMLRNGRIELNANIP